MSEKYKYMTREHSIREKKKTKNLFNFVTQLFVVKSRRLDDG